MIMCNFANTFTNECYNKDLKLAFEYQGEHHYYYIPYFHKNEETFKIKLERDILKKRLCAEPNIILIEIKYDICAYTSSVANLLTLCKSKNASVYATTWLLPPLLADDEQADDDVADDDLNTTV